MFGIYENFPETVHGIAIFNYQDSAKNIQRALLCALHHLNQEVYDLGAVTPYLKQKCEVSFEFGVAEGNVFNFLDDKELDECLKHIAVKELHHLDFFFVILYHAASGGKRVPLRFDCHILRFKFQEGWLELQIRQEKGIQRIPLDDLTEFMARQINVELSRRRLNPIALRYFEKVRLH